MSLWDCLTNEFLDNYDFWNYYRYEMRNPFVDEEAARNFILDYFKSGCKEKVLYEWEKSEDEFGSFRNIHVIYVFFIGALLQYKMNPYLKIESNTKEQDEYDKGYKFSYLWFLTCLAHDLGYRYEYMDITSEMEDVRNIYDYRCMGNKDTARQMVYDRFCLDIHRTSVLIPYNRGICYDKERRKQGSGNSNPCGNICKGFLQYNNGIKIKKGWYSSRVKENYFWYRLLARGKLDHGIVGADKFFSDMVQIYYRNYEEELEEGTFQHFRNTKNRIFSCEHFKVWAYIADCIAAHNIFKAENSDSIRKLYEEFDLRELLPENYVRISYSKNPLLFILCVADTLEPTKRFRNMDACEILENMELSYDTEQNCIYLKLSEVLAEAEGYKEYIRGINELHDWCDVEVDVV